MEEDQDYKLPKIPKIKLKTITKTTIFESEERARGRQICVEAHAHYLKVYLKGSDESYFTTWAAVFESAAAKAVREAKEAKKKT
jgi:hypothetical protein